jgi:metallophosphoesterase superfamily enzyme
MGWQLHQKCIAGPFLLTHHPATDHDAFNICGHVHPGIRLTGKGRQGIKLPCFFMRGRQLIVPAFGSFTGLHMMEVQIDDCLYVIAEQEIIAISR